MHLNRRFESFLFTVLGHHQTQTSHTTMRVLLKRLNLWRMLRKMSLRSVSLLMLAAVVISNEYLVYWVQSWRWPSLPVTSRDPDEELVILFASDPQLIGIQDEHGFPLGTITRWDSDRYLRKTFSLAYSYTRPDVVVFLGDLMDEGSKATASEYQSYYERFHSVFYPSSMSTVVYIPGDNDIGGEGADFRTRFKTSRFERHFENLTGVVNAHFVDFIKMDMRSYVDSFPEKKQLALDLTHKMKAPVRMLINHESVISQSKMFVYPLLKIAQPNLIFTGHWHESFHYVCETCLSSNEDSGHWPVHMRDMRKLDDWTEVDFTNLISLNEIMVPTCSYRMGTKNMGYGLAVLRKSGLMKYTVLWLPHRYTQLLAYLVALPILSFIIFILYIFIFVNKTHRR